MTDHTSKPTAKQSSQADTGEQHADAAEAQDYGLYRIHADGTITVGPQAPLAKNYRSPAEMFDEMLAALR